MDINKRNYEDFKQALTNLQQIIGIAPFENMAIGELQNMYDYAQDVIYEFKHLESDIGDW